MTVDMKHHAAVVIFIYLNWVLYTFNTVYFYSKVQAFQPIILNKIPRKGITTTLILVNLIINDKKKVRH